MTTETTRRPWDPRDAKTQLVSSAERMLQPKVLMSERFLIVHVVGLAINGVGLALFHEGALFGSLFSLFLQVSGRNAYKSPLLTETYHRNNNRISNLTSAIDPAGRELSVARGKSPKT